MEFLFFPSFLYALRRKIKIKGLFFVIITATVFSINATTEADENVASTAAQLFDLISIIERTDANQKSSNISNRNQIDGWYPQTATQAYLTVNSLKELSNTNFNKAKEQFKDIITEIALREKQLSDQYYVFYHGQKNYFRIVQDFLTILYEYLYQRKLNDFIFLRPWHKAFQCADVNAFIDANENNMHLKDWNDNDPDLVKKLLSVNISLFGNSWKWGESSFKYFLTNRSIKPPEIKSLFEEIFKDFNFNEKFIDQIVTLHQLIRTEQGCLFQIFVPKTIVNSIVYLSQVLGTPYRKSIIADYYDDAKQRHLCISPILEKYRNEIETLIEPDKFQARILLSREFMLNPDSGIKIFRYTTSERAKNKQYLERLHSIIKAMIIDWFESGNYKDNLFFKETPLYKTILI